MADQTYTPTPELQNLLDDKAQRNREAAMPEVPTRPAPPIGAAPAALDDGTPVTPFDDTPTPITSFKRSQIAAISKKPGEYAKHRDAILEAQRLGLIEDDMTPEALRPDHEPSKAEKEAFNRSYLPVLVRRANDEANRLFKIYETTKADYEAAKGGAYDDHERVARQARMNDAETAWKAANDHVKELRAKAKQ